MLPAVDSNLKDIHVQGDRAFPIQYYVDELEKYPGQMIAPHWHPELEFYVVRGCPLKVQLGRETLMLNEGEGVFVNADVLHAYTSGEKGVSTHPNIVFSGELIAPYGSVVHSRYMGELIGDEEIPYILLRQECPWQGEILTLLDKLFSLLQKYGRASEYYGPFPQLPFKNADIASVCYELDVQILLGQIWKMIYEHRKDIPRANAPKGTKMLQIRVQKMLSYIHDNYSHPLSLQEIASVAGISKSEAARCFETYLRTSPGRYLREYRLRQAQKQLLQTEDTVAEIAESCGFETASYFCKMFKACIGLTPLQYRQSEKCK